MDKEEIGEIIADFLHPEFGSYWWEIHHSEFNPEAPEFEFAYELIQEFVTSLSIYLLAEIN